MKINLKQIPTTPFIFLALTLVAYINAFTNQFMLDDFIVLFGQKGVANKTLFDVFTAEQGSFFRPVGHIVMWFCYRLFKDGVVAYHIVNWLMFSGITTLFYYILRRLDLTHGQSLLIAGLYAIHPINAMLVNYVTASVISTYVIFSQITFLIFLKYVKEPSKRLYAVVIGLFILSLLSHEMAMTLPVVLLAYLWFFNKRSIKQSLLLISPMLVITVMYYLWRMQAFNFNRTVWGTDLATQKASQFIPTVFDLIYWYIKKLIWPMDILFLWSQPLTNSHLVWKTLALLAIILGCGYLIFFVFKKGIKAFALTIFAIGLTPIVFASFTYYPFVPPIIEPHWFYFTSIGFFILVGMGLGIAIRRLPDMWQYISILIITGTLIQSTLLYNTKWKDEKIYCKYWLSLNQDNLTPFHGYGHALLKEKNYVGAVKAMQAGIDRLGYHSLYLLTDLGYAYHMAGSTKNAIRFYKAAIKEDPEYALVYHRAGLLNLKLKNWAQAKKAFELSIKLDPKFTKSRLLLDKLNQALARQTK